MDAWNLKVEVLRRCALDQEMRQQLVSSARNPDDIARLRRVDADNLVWLRSVVQKVGWPSRTVLGDDGAQAFWLLVQHADADVEFQAHCLAALAAAVDAGDANATALAYLTDRVRVARGEGQLYGTQCELRNGKFVPRPLEDEDTVEERRKAVGLPPLSEYLAQMSAVLGDTARSTSRPA